MRRTVGVRREEILAAASALLDRVGLAELRVSDIAKTMGVSTSLLFYHFHSKDALVAEAFAHGFEQELVAFGLATEDADPLVKLRRLVRLFDDPTGPAGWQLWIDACAVAQREPNLQAGLREIDRRYREFLTSVLAEGTAAGVFACTDPSASAARVMALNDGLSTAVMVLHSVSQAQLGEWMRTQIATEAGLHPDLLLEPNADSGPHSGALTGGHRADFTD